MFDSGLRRADIAQALGDASSARFPNDYALVREAIDRGVPLDEVKPGNKITGAAEQADRCRPPTAKAAPRRPRRC